MALAALVGPLAMFRWAGEPEAAAEGAENSASSLPEPPPEPAPTAPPPPDPADFADPRTWTGLVEDPGEPPPLTFRGTGPPTVAVVEGVLRLGRRLVVDVLPAAPPGRAAAA